MKQGPHIVRRVKAKRSAAASSKRVHVVVRDQRPFGCPLEPEV